MNTPYGYVRKYKDNNDNNIPISTAHFIKYKKSKDSCADIH